MEVELKKLLTAMRVSLRWLNAENIALIRSQFEQANSGYRLQFAKAIEKLLKHKVLIDATTLPFLMTLFSEQAPEDYSRSLVYLKKANLLNLQNFELLKQRQAPISCLLQKLSAKSVLTPEIFEACVRHSLNLCGTPTLRNQYYKILNATKINEIFGELIALSTQCNRQGLSSFDAQEKILNYLQQYQKTSTGKYSPQATEALAIPALRVEPQLGAISEDNQEIYDDFFETFRMSEVNERLPVFELDESNATDESLLTSDLELAAESQSTPNGHSALVVVSGSDVFWGPLEPQGDAQLEETAPKRHKTEALNLEQVSGVPGLFSLGFFSSEEYIDADELVATLPFNEAQP